MKVIGLLFILLLTPLAIAHSGRTDSKGGHNDNINGGYHYHNNGVSKERNTAVTQKPKNKRHMPFWQILLASSALPVGGAILLYTFASISSYRRRND